MTTEIILKKDVDGLGEEGEVKKVTAGYARNYLLPFGFAVKKTPANLKKLETEREVIKQRKAQKIEVSKNIIEKIENLTLEFEENAGENEKLFGSITQSDIAQAINDKGFEIEKKQVILPHAIKTLGDHKVQVKFYGNLVSTLNVIVKEKEK